MSVALEGERQAVPVLQDTTNAVHTTEEHMTTLGDIDAPGKDSIVHEIGQDDVTGAENKLEEVTNEEAASYTEEAVPPEDEAVDGEEVEESAIHSEGSAKEVSVAEDVIIDPISDVTDASDAPINEVPDEHTTVDVMDEPSAIDPHTDAGNLATPAEVQAIEAEETIASGELIGPVGPEDVPVSEPEAAVTSEEAETPAVPEIVTVDVEDAVSGTPEEHVAGEEGSIVAEVPTAVEHIGPAESAEPSVEVEMATAEVGTETAETAETALELTEDATEGSAVAEADEPAEASATGEAEATEELAAGEERVSAEELVSTSEAEDLIVEETGSVEKPGASENEPSVQEDIFAEEEAVAGQGVTTPEEASHVEEVAAVEDSAPVEEAAPAREAAPAEELILTAEVLQEAVVEDPVSVEEDVSQETAPVDDTSVADRVEDTIPVEEEALPVEEAAPVEEVNTVEEAVSVEDATDAAEPVQTSVEEAVVQEESAPSTEEPTYVEEAVPVDMDATAQEPVAIEVVEESTTVEALVPEAHTHSEPAAAEPVAEETALIIETDTVEVNSTVEEMELVQETVAAEETIAVEEAPAPEEATVSSKDNSPVADSPLVEETAPAEDSIVAVEPGIPQEDSQESAAVEEVTLVAEYAEVISAESPSEPEVPVADETAVPSTEEVCVESTGVTSEVLVDEPDSEAGTLAITSPVETVAEESSIGAQSSVNEDVEPYPQSTSVQDEPLSEVAEDSVEAQDDANVVSTAIEVEADPLTSEAQHVSASLAEEVRSGSETPDVTLEAVAETETDVVDAAAPVADVASDVAVEAEEARAVQDTQDGEDQEITEVLDAPTSLVDAAETVADGPTIIVDVSQPENDAAIVEDVDSGVLMPDQELEIERPKTPWTPSYSVTTQGPGVNGVEGSKDAEEIEGLAQLPPPITVIPDEISPSEVKESITDVPAIHTEVVDSSEAESLLAPSEANIDATEAIPAQAAPTIGDTVEALTSSSWIPSYSVSSQGNSPLPSPKSAPAEDAALETVESIQAPEVPAVVVSVAEEPLIEVEHIETSEIQIPAETVEKAAEDPILSTSEEKELEAGVSSANTLPLDDERPKSPWVPSYSVNSQGTSPLHSPKPTEDADVEELQALTGPAIETADDAPTVIVSEAGMSSLETADQSTVDEQPPTNDTPAIIAEAVSPVSSEPSQLVVDMSSAAIEELERPKSPWTPSYSVIQQGSSPLVGPVAIDDNEVDPLEHPSIAATPAEDQTNVEVIEGEVALEVTAGIPAVESEVLPEDQLHDIEVADSQPSIIVDEVEPTVAEVPEVPVTEERPERPWTPSYSVTTQGPATPKMETSGIEENAAQDIASNGLNGSRPFPTVEEAVEPQKVAAKPSLARLAPVNENEQIKINADSEAQPGSVSPTTTRTRLESTTSSRFFPGGWFSSTPKLPEEGRTSHENVEGEFYKSQTSATDSPALEVPTNTPTDGVIDEKKKNAKWCIVM